LPTVHTLPKSLLVFVLVSSSAAPTAARAEEAAAPPPPCQDPGFRQLDFWVGTWDLTWNGGTGTNVITRDEYGDCVILERFADDEPGGFRGTSMSTYDPHAELWRQTWVDNAGAYLDFTGGWDGERMTLGRTMERDGKSVMQRMVFHDIEADSLTWDWQTSTDGGETWAMRWQIGYRRRE
jgi:hypothetical protein